MLKGFIFFFFSVLLAACSNQGAYNSFQESLKQECRRQPPAQQEKCLNDIQDDYQEYRRQRDELLDE